MEKAIRYSLFAIAVFFYFSCEKNDLGSVEEEKLRKSAQVGVIMPRLNADGILTFSDEGHIEHVVAYLEDLSESGINEYTEEELDSDCTKENKALDVFEEDLNHHSMRSFYSRLECQELESGVSIENLSSSPFPDDVFSTLLNEYGELVIGEYVYIFKSPNLYMRTSVVNIDEALKFRNGNIGDYSLFDIMGNDSPYNGAESGCDINYDINVNRQAKQVTVIWNGSATLNHKIKYDWGDGTVDTLQAISGGSKTHTYANTGSYTILITVFNDVPSEQCAASKSEEVNLSQLCIVAFTANEGVNGLQTFSPFNLVLANGVTPVRWEWDFGDGTRDTILGINGTTSHIFPCEAVYPVSLKLITTNPDCSPEFRRSITVSNSICLDLDYDSDWSDKLYIDAGTDYRLAHRTWLKVNFWSLFSGDPKYHKVKAKVKHYKKRSNGKYRKSRKSLKIEFSGAVYGAGANNCLGEKVISLDDKVKERTRKSMTYTVDLHESIGVKDTNPYTVEYSVDGVLIHTKVTVDAGC